MGIPQIFHSKKKKEKVRNNWDFFGDWMQLLIHDLACPE
jgi:hypothetical protein